MIRRTGNPSLNDKVFDTEIANAGTVTETMTIQGTVNKTVFLVLLVLLTAGISWKLAAPVVDAAGVSHLPSIAYPLMIGGAIVGLVFALITMFKKQYAYITAPLYCLAEGFFLGGISVLAESFFPGIVLQAVGLTFGVVFALLAAYKSGLIKATENFKLGVAAATGGIFLVYMVSWIMSFFGSGIGFIHESGLMGIGFSVFVVIIAALNLVLDFDFIENGEAAGAPQYMEWYGAFGLMVTLIWLYVEILRLLMKLASRD